MSTLNIPRRATQGDTIADAIGQVARTFADAQLRQEAIDATQRANEARLKFESDALTQRVKLANAAATAKILAAEVRVKAEKEAAGKVQEAAQKRKETPTAAAPATGLERAGQLADILKAGVDTFDQATINAINAQIQSELAPEQISPGEAEAVTTFPDLDSFTTAFQADQGRAPSKTELERARIAGILTDTPSAARVSRFTFPRRR